MHFKIVFSKNNIIYTHYNEKRDIYIYVYKVNRIGTFGWGGGYQLSRSRSISHSSIFYSDDTEIEPN